MTDRLADEAMWSEVLNLGAHDLLMQPFAADEVVRVVAYAWRSWKTEWMRCHASDRTGAARTDAA